jgi:basic membrane protein A
LALVLIFSLAACKSNPKEVETPNDILTVGFICSGTITDGGNTQAQNNGAKFVEEYFNGKVKTLVLENVDASIRQSVQNAVYSLTQQGAKVVVGTDTGYRDTIYGLANSAAYKDIIFLLFSGSQNANKLSNVDYYFGATEEPIYLSGIIAGKQTKSKKLGYLAAYQTTESFISINAFTLGARSVNPKADVYVVFTQSSSDPDQELSAAEVLLDMGCDIITQHGDTTRPLLAAEEAEAFAIGCNIDNPSLAPGAWLTAAPVWRHERYLVSTIEKIIAGNWTPESFYGNLEMGYVDIAPLSVLVTQEARDAVEEAKKALISGEINIFTGPLKDNQGDLVVSEGAILDRERLWETDYFLAGVNVIELSR